ncbi:hypothetical protein C791_2811 [Amycolatopsis azurea DSM 43854]|uniref:Uncharacterized protein n=1 Tax=Amycolatopsis azurea DSM 43854 TaxID=1238180 RepID=M2QJD9_9PSEU|nr:hypothetical protein C791_2811 [Amycolatopsis azurea DSM 43854]
MVGEASHAALVRGREWRFGLSGRKAKVSCSIARAPAGTPARTRCPATHHRESPSPTRRDTFSLPLNRTAGGRWCPAGCQVREGLLERPRVPQGGLHGPVFGGDQRGEGGFPLVRCGESPLRRGSCGPRGRRSPRSVAKATFATFNVAKVAFATPEVGHICLTPQ